MTKFYIGYNSLTTGENMTFIIIYIKLALIVTIFNLTVWYVLSKLGDKLHTDITSGIKMLAPYVLCSVCLFPYMLFRTLQYAFSFVVMKHKERIFRKNMGATEDESTEELLTKTKKTCRKDTPVLSDKEVDDILDEF